MATRLYFEVVDNEYLVDEKFQDFVYYSGFALSQKQKSVKSLHDEISKSTNKKILEISSKSLNEFGKKLSAFNLTVDVNGKKIALENIFQSSKVFEKGGPYVDLLNTTPIAAKKDDRIRNSGNLIKFIFNGKDYPINPKSVFYDYMYCCALIKNKEFISELIKYEVFTDIEFNHDKSINCQARSAALFVSLYKKNLIKKYLSSFDDFITLPYYNHCIYPGIQRKIV